MTVDLCKCRHSKQSHEVAGLAPQCTSRGCECLRYRPSDSAAAVAPPRPMTVATGSVPHTIIVTPTATPVPSAGPTAEQLIAAGKRSSLKRVVALAEKEQEAARREIRRLEKQLADAKARLKTTRHELGLPGGERPADGVNQCPDCPETFDTAQRLGVHRRWKHGYRKATS